MTLRRYDRLVDKLTRRLKTFSQRVIGSTCHLVIFFFIFNFLFLSPIHAFTRQVPDTSKVRNRDERFFDLDKNGKVNAYERSLVTTYQRTRWRLARSKRQKSFDKNGDHMLEPYEEKAYQKARKRSLQMSLKL